MITATLQTGRIGMIPEIAEALAEFRRFNYEHVYLREKPNLKYYLNPQRHESFNIDAALGIVVLLLRFPIILKYVSTSR